MRLPIAVALFALLVGAGGLGSPTAAGGETLEDVYNRLSCTPGYKWLRPSQRALLPTEPIQRNENRTSRAQTATFTSTRTRTVQHSVSGGVESEIGGGYPFLHASIKARFGIEVVASKTATINNSQTEVVGPHRVAIGKYGVYVRRFPGYFVRRRHSGERVTNPKCPQLILISITATLPLNEVGWVISSAPAR